MIYEISIPPPPLSYFIDHFFYYEGFHSDHLMEKFLPDGSSDLLIDLTDTPKKLFSDESGLKFTSFKRSWISGIKTRYILIDASVSCMIGVHFKPGGLRPFVNFPVMELTDETFSLDTIWGDEVNLLREAILEAESIKARFGLLQSFMLKKGSSKLEKNNFTFYALQRLNAQPSIDSINDISRAAGVSQKHLINLFKKEVGLTPKQTARIMRFQNVIRTIERQKRFSWTSIAYDCDYYDQSHFIKEFREFSGINPQAYLLQKGEYLNYLPVRTGG